jgi:hypothetical protein
MFVHGPHVRAQAGQVFLEVHTAGNPHPVETGRQPGKETNPIQAIFVV